MYLLGQVCGSTSGTGPRFPFDTASDESAEYQADQMEMQSQVDAYDQYLRGRWDEAADDLQEPLCDGEEDCNRQITSIYVQRESRFDGESTPAHYH